MKSQCIFLHQTQIGLFLTFHSCKLVDKTDNNLIYYLVTAEIKTVFIVTMAHDNDKQSEQGILVEETRPEVKKPTLYKVVLLNDEYTPMDFVVAILQAFFQLTEEKATQVMLQVHYRGKGICGVFTREIAETKVEQVNDYSRSHEHPLLCVMEEM